MDEEAARKLDALVVEMYALCARWDANRARRRVPTHIAAALMTVAAEIAALSTSKDSPPSLCGSRGFAGPSCCVLPRGHAGEHKYGVPESTTETST